MGQVSFKTALPFALPAVISVFSTRKYLVPAIPENILTVGNFIFTKEIAIMIFFALLMLTAAATMILNSKASLKNVTVGKGNTTFPILIVLGLFTGLITGLVGAGGGFIIIPILVLLAGLSMKKAVGTSLFIMAINSLLGFLGDMGHFDIDWQFLLSFTAIAIIGVFIGIWLNNFINGNKLKRGFGWFVLIMAIYILVNELLH